MGVRTVLVGVALLGSAQTAWAFPCTVEGDTTFTECVNTINSGEEILLPAMSEVEISGPYLLRKDVVVRSVSPDWPGTIRHKREDAGAPTDPSPIPNGALFVLSPGVTLTLNSVDVEPLVSPDDPSIAAARLFSVEGGTLNLNKVRMSGVIGYNKGAPSSLPGGYLAHVTSGGKAVLTGVVVTDVDAYAHLGGVLYADNGGEIVIDSDSRFERCHGWKGGVAYARYGGIITVQNSAGTAQPVFTDNSARSLGGALGADGNSSSRATLTVQSGRFEKNRSWDKGGQIGATYTDLVIDGAVIREGSATYGAGVYARNSNLTVTYSTLAENVAGSDGGGVDAYQADSVTIAWTRFEKNQADRGAAVYATGAVASPTIDSSQFCQNDAGQGNDLYADLSPGLNFHNNLIDGDRTGRGSSVEVRSQPYDIFQNSFVRTPDVAIKGLDSPGRVERNAFGWTGGSAAILAEATPSSMQANSFYDPDGNWITDPIWVGGSAAGMGPRGTLGPLGITGTRGDGELTGLCEVTPHYLRPDGPLLDAAWDDPDIEANVRGFLGGGAPYERPGLVEPWVDDRDSDGIIAIWDCDDEDDQLGRLCGNEPGDTDDTDAGDTDGPADTDDGPIIGPEGIYWYGSCSSTSVGALFLPALFGGGLVVLLRRRRRRRVV